MRKGTQIKLESARARQVGKKLLSLEKELLVPPERMALECLKEWTAAQKRKRKPTS